MCIGKRFAEQSIYTLLTKLLQRYCTLGIQDVKVVWHYLEDGACSNSTILVTSSHTFLAVMPLTGHYDMMLLDIICFSLLLSRIRCLLIYTLGVYYSKLSIFNTILLNALWLLQVSDRVPRGAIEEENQPGGPTTHRCTVHPRTQE